jgi:hypothetical protein
VKTLILPVKRLYFDQIQDGLKDEEYRLVTPFWTKRLENRSYDRIIVTLGYPAKEDDSKRLEFPWKGVQKKTIEEFGPGKKEVFAIQLDGKSGRPLSLF